MLYEKRVESKRYSNLLYELERLGTERTRELKKIQEFTVNLVQERGEWFGVGFFYSNHDVYEIFDKVFRERNDVKLSDVFNELIWLSRKRKNNVLKNEILKIFSKKFSGFVVQDWVFTIPVDNTNEDWTFRKKKIEHAIVRVTKKGVPLIFLSRIQRKRWTSVEPNSIVLDKLEDYYVELFLKAIIQLEKENKLIKEAHVAAMKESEPLLLGLRLSEE